MVARNAPQVYLILSSAKDVGGKPYSNEILTITFRLEIANRKRLMAVKPANFCLVRGIAFLLNPGKTQLNNANAWDGIYLRLRLDISDGHRSQFLGNHLRRNFAQA